MVDSLDKFYTKIVDNNKFLIKIKFYSLIRFIFRGIVNVIVPVYYCCKKVNNLPQKNSKRNPKIIVTLTTFPKRIRKVWIVIESLLRQKTKPDLIILWLSKEQFHSIECLPKRLKKLCNRGLEIRFCDGDLKSHKKYYYALKDFPNDFLITVDDDIIYPSNIIEDLLKLHMRYPNSICCHGAKIIKTNKGLIKPYLEWESVINEIGPDHSLFFTSGCGTLFPPKSLPLETLNKEVFQKYCFYADDVWLNFMCRLNNSPIIKSNFYSNYLPIMYFGNLTLDSVNNQSGENDKQIVAVRNYYIQNSNIDLLNKVTL